MILNFKRNRSAGTADEKSSKCSWLAGRPLLLAILLLSVVYCQAQDSTAVAYSLKDSTLIYASNSLLSFKAPKDSTWYVNRVDTIRTDFVIIVDSNNFVKKVRCDFIVHKYEELQHSGYGLRASSFYTNRNETFLLNNNPVEVLLYRPKGEEMLVGNSR